MSGVGGRVRAIVTVLAISLLGVLSLDCGGTFCDEYPEACGAVGEGGGGSGGGTIGPFEVEVSLLDLDGVVMPLKVGLLSDAEGAEVSLFDTGSEGTEDVIVPGDGYFISVFHQDGDAHVFTALALRGVPKLTFQLPPPPPSNSPADFVVQAACSSCLNDTDLSLSCRTPLAMSFNDTEQTVSVAGYAGCASTDAYDAYVVSYGVNGEAQFASSGSALLPDVVSLPALSTVDADERFSFNMDVENNTEQVTRTVRVPYTDRPGFGFSRAFTDAEPSAKFSLVTEFVPRAQATFAFGYQGQRSRWRQQTFDPLGPDSTASFEPSSVALPKKPGAIEAETASFALDDGPEGDAVQLRVLAGGETLTWIVSVPAAMSGSVRFPQLPATLADYALDGIDDYDVLHLDLDGVEGFSAFASEPILDYGSDAGLGDLTIARSSTIE